MTAGLKKITQENWLEPDKTASTFVRFSPESRDFKSISKVERLNDYLQPT